MKQQRDMREREREKEKNNDKDISKSNALRRYLPSRSGIRRRRAVELQRKEEELEERKG